MVRLPSTPSLACKGQLVFFQEYRLQSKDLPAELVRATPNPAARFSPGYAAAVQVLWASSGAGYPRRRGAFGW